jgi:hypothetical protein
LRRPSRSAAARIHWSARGTSLTSSQAQNSPHMIESSVATSRSSPAQMAARASSNRTRPSSTRPVIRYTPPSSGPRTSFGGDTRRRAELRLVNLNGVLGTGKGVSAKFSSNANTGGTCFGDSGGPIFVDGTTTLVAVVSFGTSSTCSGTSGAYRLDQADDLAFLATFGITP